MLVGEKVRTRIRGFGTHEGTVAEELDDGKFLVQFDDGDERPYTRAAVEKMLISAAAAEPAAQPAPGGNDPASPAEEPLSSRRPSRAAALKAVGKAKRYAEEDEWSSDGFDSEDSDGSVRPRKRQAPPKAKARAASARSKGKRRARPDSDEDDDDYEGGDGSSADEEEEDDDDDEYVEEGAGPSRGRSRGGRGRTSAKPAGGGGPKFKRASGEADNIVELEDEDLENSAGFKVGAKIPTKHRVEPYVDTLGHGALSSGVESLVTNQWAKLMPLLSEAVRRGDLRHDLQLHTHCSGTDCISIALELGAALARESGGELAKVAWEHVLSCENEPFKQAYLARNFPQVLLRGLRLPMHLPCTSPSLPLCLPMRLPGISSGAALARCL